MDLCSFIVTIIELCCSLFASILSYRPLMSDLSSTWSLPMEQTWMLALDFFTSMCWISYAIYQHPLSWFLFISNISPPVFQLLCFITAVCYRFRGSQFSCPECRTIMALGTSPLIFIVVSLLWIFDVLGRLCFAIFAILSGTSSFILSVVQLWRGRIGDWLILVLLRHILGVVGGVVGLLMGVWQQNILFMINSAVVFVFGLVQLGVAFFAHEIHGIPWFSRGTSNSLPSESEQQNGS